jgi:prepilin-type N-terminal cleavage/methylation domain-containing protein
MKINSSRVRAPQRGQRGFTFVEVMVATAITLVMFITFYAAMSSGVRTVQVARENLRATEIMVGQMEGIRLFSWTQLTNTTLLPTNFIAGFSLNGTNNQGITYTGAVSVAAATFATSPSYAGNIKKVTITLQWNSGGVLRQRQMTTYCAQYGVQPYVLNN